jgi:hypothetical protein
MPNPSLFLLSHPPPRRVDNRLTVTLCLCGNTHRIRGLLKSLGANGWRCIRASKTPGVALPLTTEVIVMDKADLQTLQQYAASTRSHLAFGGVPFIPLDWKVGKYLVGKSKIDFTGKRVAADVPYTMVGFREWRDGKPSYYLTRLLDKTIAPLERNELGQTNESLWVDGKDPLVAVTVVPVFDAETRQVFIITAAYGDRAETGSVIDAFVVHNAERPDAEEPELPVIELLVRSYTKGDGKPGFAMQLDLTGDWITRPPSLFRVLPSPLKITVTEAAKSNSKSKAAADDKPAKPKRKVAIAGKSADDSEIPF